MFEVDRSGPETVRGLAQNLAAAASRFGSSPGTSVICLVPLRLQGGAAAVSTVKDVGCDVATARISSVSPSRYATREGRTKGTAAGYSWESTVARLDP